MMRKGEHGQSVRMLTRGLLLAATVAVALGCSGEHFSGDTPSAGTGGGGFGSGGGGAIVGMGTGGDGTGGMGIGGDGTGGDGSGGMGTGGDGTGGGSGGASLDTAPDLASMADADAARDTGTGGNRDAADGVADAARDAAACVNGTRDLSNLGMGDFHISFRVETTQTGSVALMNQRDICNFVVFWDIRQSVDGLISVETGNSRTSYQNVRSAVKINDGVLHDVAVARVSGALSIRIDGVVSGIGPSTASLGALAPLRIGSDVCGLTNNPPTATFAGKTLTDPCITR